MSDINIQGNILRIKHVAINDVVNVYWKPKGSTVFSAMLSESTDPMWQLAADEKSENNSGRPTMSFAEWWLMLTNKVSAWVNDWISKRSPSIQFTVQDWESELDAALQKMSWSNNRLS